MEQGRLRGRLLTLALASMAVVGQQPARRGSKAPAKGASEATTQTPTAATNDPMASLIEVRKKADAGDPKSMLAVGLFSWQAAHLGGDQSPDSQKMRATMLTNAATWFEKSYSYGCKEAEYWYAHALCEGEGIPKDFGKGWKIMNESGEHGDISAQIYLSVAYATGTSVPVDYSMAAIWAQKAAIQDKEESARAQFLLGYLFESGQGVPPSSTKALYWYKKSAAHGNTAAQGALMRLTGEDH